MSHGPDPVHFAIRRCYPADLYREHFGICPPSVSLFSRPAALLRTTERHQSFWQG